MADAELSDEAVRWLGSGVADDVATAFRNSSRDILGVDGFMGAGKSPFASMMEHQLGVRCIRIDDYLPTPPDARDNRDYVSKLDTHRLKHDLEFTLRDGQALIEGILLRDILHRTETSPSVFHVYVAAVWVPDRGSVRWNEGDRLQPGAENDVLDRQIVDYHNLWLPHQNCDVAVLRDGDRYDHVQGCAAQGDAALRGCLPGHLPYLPERGALQGHVDARQHHVRPHLEDAQGPVLAGAQLGPGP